MSRDDSWQELIPSALKPIVYSYKYRHSIQRFWATHVSARVKTPNVIITGKSGVGKSVLASHYHGEANKLDWQLPDTSFEVEIKPITIGDWTKVVAVIPGHGHADRVKALDKILNQSSSLEGVIHVVDWGYTSIRSALTRDTFIDTHKVLTIEQLRQHNLKTELDEFKTMLDKLETAIMNKRGPNWLVIAVNKVDLFTDKMLDAEKYYSPSFDSDFSRLLKDFLSVVGKANIYVKCLPVCPMPEPFTWNDETQYPQISSTTKQKNLLRVFVDQVAELERRSKK